MRLPARLRMTLALVRPFRSIAKDLHKLVQLYELDLASRTPPIWLPSEDPRRDDTTVTYTGERDDRPKWKRWMDWHDQDDQAGQER